MPQITIMDGTGDSVVRFDPADADSLARAEAAFTEHIRPELGRQAFAIDTPGQPGRKITKFEPGASEILFIAPIVGG